MREKIEKSEEIIKEEIEKIKNKIKTFIILIIVMICLIPIIFYYAISNSQGTISKPIIYIYPEAEQEVTISVSNPEKFTTTYPRYENNWNVIAKPDGELVDKKSGRKLYSLYWEGKKAYHSDMTKGFIIKGEDTAEFLEEKLEILGLNERETEEFIIYWLPKMEHNKYNYIYFQTMKEIDDYMKLEIEPKPETLIRIYMEFKALDKPKEIEQQELTKIERTGYTVVEWGGTQIK